jgi:hypothetical protein
MANEGGSGLHAPTPQIMADLTHFKRLHPQPKRQHCNRKFTTATETSPKQLRQHNQDSREE